jgi:peroxiredoxin
LLRFQTQQGFGFRLLSGRKDEEGAQFDVLRDQDGPAADRPERITYLISPDGVIAESFAVTDASDSIGTHPQEVLDRLVELDKGRGPRNRCL